MKSGRRGWTTSRVALCGVAIGAAAVALVFPEARSASTWKRAASPGDLTSAHAHLDDSCESCHTPGAGVEPASCIACHATDRDVLQRQPTAFHAQIDHCVDCHPEHRGAGAPPTEMSHESLVRIGLRRMENHPDPESEDRDHARRIVRWLDSGGARSSAGPAAALACSTCHSNDDRHFDLFGSDCVACHETRRWSIPGFRHPPPSSRDCSQCHQAPPSHYRRHFHMISRRVAGKPHAEVDECYECHQTTAWPDIKGVGWYKHH